MCVHEEERGQGAEAGGRDWARPRSRRKDMPHTSMVRGRSVQISRRGVMRPCMRALKPLSPISSAAAPVAAVSSTSKVIRTSVTTEAAAGLAWRIVSSKAFSIESM